MSKNDPIYDLLKDEDFNTNSEVFKFVTSEKVISIVSDYLGFIPLLTTVSLWYSPNLQNFDQSSQFFHLDHEDVSQVKCFFIEDIDLDMGPTQFINIENSKKLLKKIKYRINKEEKRISDNLIYETINEDEVMSCVGKKYYLFFDTSRCFHADLKIKKPRIVLFFKYLLI